MQTKQGCASPQHEDVSWVCVLMQIEIIQNRRQREKRGAPRKELCREAQELAGNRLGKLRVPCMLFSK